MSVRFQGEDAYFAANAGIVHRELHPGRTVTFLAEVDLSEVEQVRAASRRRGGEAPSYTAFVVRALALALRDHPAANRRVCRRRWWLPGSRLALQAFARCDVGVACERELPGIDYCAFVDILRDADRCSLEQTTDWLRELSQADRETNAQWRDFTRVIEGLPRWLAGLLISLPAWVPSLWTRYRGAAALVSSPAKYGVDCVVGTWTSPLGVSFGLVKPRPVVRDGAVVVRPTFTLTLNFDRRVMAGAAAARFFRRIVERLERAWTELADVPLPEAARESARAA